MLISFGAVIGMNGSQLCFIFILAGIIAALYGIRSIQGTGQADQGNGKEQNRSIWINDIDPTTNSLLMND